jgi:hypothetical protein
MSDAHKPRGRVRWGYLNTARALSNKGKRVTEKEAKKREEEVLKRERESRNTKNKKPHGHITIGEPDHGHDKPGDDPKPNVPRKPTDKNPGRKGCPEYFQFPGGFACGPKPVNANPLDSSGDPTPANPKKPEPEPDPREAERLLMKELLAAGAALADKIVSGGFGSLSSEEKALYHKIKGNMYRSDINRINAAMGTFFVYQIKCQAGRFPPSCVRANIKVFDDDQLDKWQDKAGWVVDTTHADEGSIPVDMRTYYKPTSKKVEGYIDWNRKGQPGEPSPGPKGKGKDAPAHDGWGNVFKEGWPSAVEWQGSDHWLSYKEMDIDVALASHGTSDVDATMKAEGWFTEVPKAGALIELVEEDEKETQDDDCDDTRAGRLSCGKYMCGPHSASTGFVCESNGYSKSENDRREAEKTPADSSETPPVDPTTPAAAEPETHDAGGRATLAYINSMAIDCARVHKDNDNACELYEEAIATREESPVPEEEEEKKEEPPPPLPQSPSIRVVRVQNTDGGQSRCGAAPPYINNRNAYVMVGADFRAWARSVGTAKAIEWVNEQTAICLNHSDFASVDYKPAKYVISS